VVSTQSTQGTQIRFFFFFFFFNLAVVNKKYH
jgi:hypothetical protein